MYRITLTRLGEAAGRWLASMGTSRAVGGHESPPKKCPQGFPAKIAPKSEEWPPFAFALLSL